MNGKLIKQLNFKTLFSIALPISIQSLLQSSLGMIDQIMIGQLGETAVASVNLGTRLMFIMVYSLLYFFIFSNYPLIPLLETPFIIYFLRKINTRNKR